MGKFNRVCKLHSLLLSKGEQCFHSLLVSFLDHRTLAYSLLAENLQVARVEDPGTPRMALGVAKAKVLKTSVRDLHHTLLARSLLARRAEVEARFPLGSRGRSDFACFWSKFCL